MSFKTKIIAHRGFSSNAPENTMAAFKKAIHAKADYMELDVHQTIDGTIVVIHDKSIDRTSSNGKKGEIKNMTSEELKNIYVGYSTVFGDQFREEKIPTLQDVLKFVKGRIKVCIEIKVTGIEKKVLDILKETKMCDSVMVFSFHLSVLKKIRALDTQIPILYLQNRLDNHTLETIKNIKCDALGVGKESIINKDIVDFYHSQKIKIFKWTIDNENEMMHLFKMGIDGLITNEPTKALYIRDL